MYSVYNYKTKKALKEAIEEYNKGDVTLFQYYQPGPFGGGSCSLRDGETVTLEGPHYPEPHKWYAQVTRRGNKLVVK